MKPGRLFLHRLALALGKTVGELRDLLTAHELVDWMRYASQFPFPAEMVDAHGATLTALLANVHRQADTPAYDSADFRRLEPRDPPPAQPVMSPSGRRLTEAERIKLAMQGARYGS